MNLSKSKFTVTQKAVFVLAMIMIFSVDALFAQNGATGITAGTTQLKSFLTPVTNLTMAIGGIVGIIGGVRIYNKWNSGDQDINKELMGWGGSCVFLIVAPLVVKGFFGL